MNRKAEKFFDAITLLREDLVEEAQNYVFQKKRSGWKKFGSLAACILLVMSLGMLAVLPRGCGGSGGSDMNSSSAPMESPPATSEPSGSASADGAPRPPDGNEEPEQGGNPAAPAEVRFMGQVSEILEDGLLVEPFSDSLSYAGDLYVPTEGLEDLPAFYPGAVVEVLCGAVSDGAAEDVTEVWLLEP